MVRSWKQLTRSYWKPIKALDIKRKIKSLVNSRLLLFIFYYFWSYYSLANFQMNLLRIFLIEFLTGSLRALNPNYFFIMKLCTNQSIPCEYLKGACIFLSDEDEGEIYKRCMCRS